MLIIANTESPSFVFPQKSKCRSFSGDHGKNSSKYAKLRRVQTCGNLCIYRHFGTKKSSAKGRKTGKTSEKNGYILVKNEGNELFQQLTHACIWVIKTLTFGINLSNFIDYLHYFHRRVISHAQNILLGSPSIS